MPRNYSRKPDPWKVPPYLAAYLNCVGAEMRNFKRYVIKREGRDHYHYDSIIITIDKDGKLALSPDDCPEDLKPTEQERQNIETEIAAAHALWPTSTPARDTDELREIVGPNAQLFEYSAQYPKDGQNILFVQHRVNHEDGGKSDYAWSYWSDNEWRNMEPDGLLPLWRLDQLGAATVVFLHEGAKGAATVSAPGFLKGHPWIDNLTGHGVVHLGWPGGAPNAHRVDWKPIRDLPRHIKIVIVCDKDISGKNAAPSISKRIMRKCGVICFGNQFPEHFDLADAWPETLWEQKDGYPVYTGPAFSDCWTSATWATRYNDHLQLWELREEFESEWVYTEKPNLFICKEQVDVQYSEKEFNSACRKFSNVKNVADLLIQSNDAAAKGLVYEPPLPTGQINMKGKSGTWVNVHRASSIKPIRYEKGEDQPWEAFMAHLIPDEPDRSNALKWIATLIVKPEVHMRYGMLLISETQGVGKGTLGEKILRPIIGDHNTSCPSEAELVDSNYNYWATNKRLVVVPEIYAGQSKKAYNKLKSIITDDTITVAAKYLANYNIRNWIHILACSNSMRALKLDGTDRRWFMPKVTDDKRDHAYWKKLNAWLADRGLGIIKQWAHNYVNEHGYIDDGEHPPMTERKQAVIKAAMSDGELITDDFAAALADRRPEQVVVRMDEYRTWLANEKVKLNPKYQNEAYLELPEKVSSIFRRHGLFVYKGRFREKNEPDGTRGKKFSVVANFEIPLGTTWEDLEKKGCVKKPAVVAKWIPDETGF